MILLSSIIETFESEYLAQYQDSILPGHRQALAAKRPVARRSVPGYWHNAA
jgi:hypothetical protein